MPRNPFTTGRPLQPYKLSYQPYGSESKSDIPFSTQTEMVNAAMSMRSSGHVALFEWSQEANGWILSISAVQAFEKKVVRIAGTGNIPLSLELMKLGGMCDALAKKAKRLPLDHAEVSTLLDTIEAVKTTLGPRGRDGQEDSVREQEQVQAVEQIQPASPWEENVVMPGLSDTYVPPTPEPERKRSRLFGNRD